MKSDSESSGKNEAQQLLDAALHGRGDEILRILGLDPTLIHVADAVGDTTFHVVARAGYLGIGKQLIELVRKHGLEDGLSEQNSQGDTPLHLAVKNRHQELADCLYGLNFKATLLTNNDGLQAKDIAQAHEFSDLKWYIYAHIFTDMEMDIRRRALLSENEDDIVDNVSAVRLIKAAIVGDKHNVSQILTKDPTLIQHRHPTRGTALHAAAIGGQVDMLRLLIGFMTDEQRVSLALERDDEGNTALHLIMLFKRFVFLDKKKEGANILIQAAPIAAYHVNRKGITPLHLIVMSGFQDLACWRQ